MDEDRVSKSLLEIKMSRRRHRADYKPYDG
jgi:hypothetical protein